MKTKILIILFAVGLVYFSSCTKYPPNVTRLQEDLVVYTQVDLETDFNQFNTFAIVDSIAYIDNKDSGRILTPDAKAVLDQIILNMQNRGFVKVDKGDNPNLGITVSVIKTTNTSVYYPGWYWGYPGYYYPPYWGYPNSWYYYPYYPTYISSYSTGTLLIDMLDFVNINEDDQIPVVWFAYIRAVMTGYHTIGEITGSIDQAFLQTPSIKTNAN